MSPTAAPLLAVTPGEPAGVGPDIALALAGGSGTEARLLVIADPDMLARRAQRLGLATHIHDWSTDRTWQPGAVNVYPVPLAAPVTPGKPDPDNAEAVIRTLHEAVSLCERGSCAAMVTGPINKAVINEAGIVFSGHTEWLQHRTDTGKVVMLLATEGLMVALATTHLPLRDVADAITGSSLALTVEVLDRELRKYFELDSPCILVLGLNPHAGEQGHLGREEIDTIIPTLDLLRARGLRLTGPVPADTAFSPRLLSEHDVVLAMFHDQGLPVLKYKGFGDAANITLGLPIIRTSVDHGTALDIAGTGTADTGSMATAIRYASRMAGRR